MSEILQGDCLEILKTLEADSVDLVATDPPYGYSFMGKDWDKAVPSVETWKECLRVLKPGAFAFVMSAPRSDVQAQMIVRLTAAGFRLDFTPIYWTYASGFPKAANMGKMVDKRNGAKSLSKAFVTAGKGKRKDLQTAKQTLKFRSDYGYKHELKSTQAKALDGSYGGFQPKPAVEVIIVAMKPLSEKTFVDQALKNGKGVTWLDDCRVPTSESVGTHCTNRDDEGKCKGHNNAGRSTSGETIHTDESDGIKGRFPANLLVSDDVLNDGTVSKSQKRSSKYNKATPQISTYTPIKSDYRDDNTYADSGSYSRYFDLDAWAKTLPFLIVPKASKGEKNEGLDGFEPLRRADRKKDDGIGGNNPRNRTNLAKVNHHPTVKPLKLMSYLITLGSREGDIVLDPFAGSCTTAVAAKNLNRKYICIERESEYVGIGKARIAAVSNNLFDV